jgi:hypothetical protein
LNVLLLALILTAVGAATIAAFLLARRRQDAGPAPGFWPTGAVTLVLIVVLSGAATAFNRDWTTWEYFLEGPVARRMATEALVEHDRCRICFGTRARAIDWRWLEPNTTDRVNIEVSTDSLTANVRVVLAGAEGAPPFGRVRADFGDGADALWTGIVEEGRLTHRYKQPGTYVLVVWLQLRSGDMRADRRTLTITGSN